MLWLKNERLSVEIAEPGEEPNNGVRFERAGFISQVTLDGNCTFCASEPRNLVHRSSGGRGLCCEYKADYSAQVQDGEWYPKPGVGLLKRNGAYHFSGEYEKKPFLVEVARDEGGQETGATFHTIPVECLGIAVETWKHIYIDGNTLTMEVKARNAGSREITFKEYCHNFLSIDGMAVSPDYRLELPDLTGLEKGMLGNEYPNEGNYLSDGKGISLAQNTLLPSLLMIRAEEAPRPFHWTMRHKGAGAAVKVTENLNVSEMCLWSVDHMLSPEMIQTVTLAPGEETMWSRVYTFEQSAR